MTPLTVALRLELAIHCYCVFALPTLAGSAAAVVSRSRIRRQNGHDDVDIALVDFESEGRKLYAATSTEATTTTATVSLSTTKYSIESLLRMPSATSSSSSVHAVVAAARNNTCGPIIASEGTTTICKGPDEPDYRPCQDHSPVGTVAKIKCDRGYRPQKGKKASVQVKCAQGLAWSGNSESFTCVVECGRVLSTRNERIIGNGQFIKHDLFPWHAALFVKTPSGFDHFCDGTLIHSKFVLTSGSCIGLCHGGIMQVVVHPSSIDYFKNRAGDSPLLKVAQTFTSPGEDTKLAILELAEPVELDGRMMPACLPGDNQEKPKTGMEGKIAEITASEYGNGDSPFTWRTLSLPVKPMQVCISPTSTVAVFNDSYCIGYKSDSLGCGVEIGTGQMFLEDGRYTLKGVKSAGWEPSPMPRSCGGLKGIAITGILISVAHYRDWILSTINNKTIQLAQSERIQPEPGGVGYPTVTTIETQPLETRRMPWLVGIYQRTTQGIYFICAAALIDPSFALTAASCFPSSTKPEDFTLVLGATHQELQANAEDSNTTIAFVESIVLHPVYRAESGYPANLALVKLDEPVAAGSTNLIPAILSTEDAVPGQIGLVPVFYRNGTTTSVTTQLVSEKFEVVNNRGCMARMYGEFPLPDHFCAVSNHTVLPTRTMGSTGFVVSQGDKFYLKGIFSHGDEKVERASLFTTVSKYIDWIKASMGAMAKKM